MFFALQLKHACRKLEDFLWICAVLFSPSEHSFSFFYLIVRVNFCVYSVSIETRKWLYKRNFHLNFYFTFHKVGDKQMLQLTPEYHPR